VAKMTIILNKYGSALSGKQENRIVECSTEIYRAQNTHDGDVAWHTALIAYGNIIESFTACQH